MNRRRLIGERRFRKPFRVFRHDDDLHVCGLQVFFDRAIDIRQRQLGELRAHDCYRPEAIEVVSFEPPAPYPAAKTNGSKANGWTKIVVRALRPAEEVEVLCNRGEPEFVRGSNICARVVSIAGPWRTQGEWWSETNFARDYYDLALADGGVYRMFHDLNNSRWFVDGIYD